MKFLKRSIIFQKQERIMEYFIYNMRLQGQSVWNSTDEDRNHFPRLCLKRK